MKVNPERQRRYCNRTLTRPEQEYVLTSRERDLMLQWDAAFMRNLEDPVERPPLWGWRARVEKYASAKGLHVEFTVEERPDLTSVIRWKERA